NLLLFAKILIGMGLLALVIYWADPAKLLHNIINADRWHLTAAFLFVLISYFLGIKRWQVLSRSLGIEVKFYRFVVLHFLGLFCNNILPSGIGGDFVKAYYLSKPDQKHKSLLSVML